MKYCAGFWSAEPNTARLKESFPPHDMRQFGFAFDAVDKEITANHDDPLNIIDPAVIRIVHHAADGVRVVVPDDQWPGPCLVDAER